MISHPLLSSSNYSPPPPPRWTRYQLDGSQQRDPSRSGLQSLQRQAGGGQVPQDGTDTGGQDHQVNNHLSLVWGKIFISINPCRFISEDTIEEGIYNVAQDKLKLEQDVTGQGEESKTKKKDVARLLKAALGVDLKEKQIGDVDSKVYMEL